MLYKKPIDLNQGESNATAQLILVSIPFIGTDFMWLLITKIQFSIILCTVIH